MDLPLTKRGNHHALVFQDNFSMWAMVYAILDQKAHRIVQILCEEIVPVLGVPEALLCNCGANLLSHLMRDICQILKLNTTSCHPQCNRLLERLNHTLKLCRHVGRFGTQWEHCVLWAKLKRTFSKCTVIMGRAHGHPYAIPIFPLLNRKFFLCTTECELDKYYIIIHVHQH